jgi:hypothetical protein
MNQVLQIWTPQPSGILVPSGLATDNDSQSRHGFLDLKDKAAAIESLFADSGVRLRSDSALGRMILNARDLWEHWFLAQGETTYEMLFTAMHLDRIAEAILPLRDEDMKVQYLNALMAGSMDFFDRKESHAKDMLWELEVWSKLRKKTTRAFLKEPPDIVVEFDDARIGLACKKVYSENGVEKVLSKAVGQIEREFEFGIAAINVDDLLPPHAILEASSSRYVKERLLQHNGQFLQRHDRHFRKYLASGRLVSVIISSSIISDVSNEKPRFNNVWQWTVWTIPGLPERHQRQLGRLYDIVMN